MISVTKVFFRGYLALLRYPHQNAAHPPHIRIQHLKINAAFMANNFAALGHAACEGKDKPANRINFFFIGFKNGPCFFLQLLNFKPCARFKNARLDF